MMALITMLKALIMAFDVDHIVVDIAASRTHFASVASLFDSRSGFLHLHIW